PQIVAALRTFNRLLCADVIILGRGGGSLEDLWPFNEESVARAVADSRIPVISAVGHETDFTICDFAADLRAPTPSAAAELAAPDSGELLAAVIFSEEQMTRSMLAGLESRKKQLDRLAASPSLKRPQELIELQRIRADHLASRLSAQMSKALSAAQARLSAAGGRLHALSPLATLSRGYSIAYDRKHRPVSKISQAQIGDFITIRLQDGSLGCTVGSREENNE
ncbi:MAG: exodeoxyribonuclease VII large subunit, partial [Clostridiales bacterium]|nr:exodeoxyribonuclease VII large subunit [Clostridiales bacterium]